MAQTYRRDCPLCGEDVDHVPNHIRNRCKKAAEDPSRLEMERRRAAGEAA